MIVIYCFLLPLISVKIIIGTLYVIITNVQSLQKTIALSKNVTGYVSVLPCGWHTMIILTVLHTELFYSVSRQISFHIYPFCQFSFHEWYDTREDSTGKKGHDLY